jgi:hypothetical protein
VVSGTSRGHRPLALPNIADQGALAKANTCAYVRLCKVFHERVCVCVCGCVCCYFPLQGDSPIPRGSTAARPCAHGSAPHSPPSPIIHPPRILSQWLGDPGQSRPGSRPVGHLCFGEEARRAGGQEGQCANCATL